MKWYGDNSECSGIWNAEIPDLVLFGGVLIEAEPARMLEGQIRTIKQLYTELGRWPMKWNFNDLKNLFKEHKRSELFHAIQQDSKKWRSEIATRSLDVDYQIVVACVKHHSVRRRIIKTTREKIARFAFSNALMRVGLAVKHSNHRGCEVVLDWPDGGKCAPYIEEYRSAFWHGRCDQNPTVLYLCGALERLNFTGYPVFTRMEECPLLQFSDLILGAVREFVAFALGQKTEDAFGVKVTKLLIPKFVGYPKRIIGRGISVAPTNGVFAHALFRAMAKLRNADERQNVS